ncbi:MAG TPA: extracellular solute-binding protein [Aggregatilineales bacterium]|nr:extracellular solute-binding protein [Anaerolineales bacterium]HRE49368.1 extracellular solute-binding protein [Aggregatilineales bacterium]
MKTRLFVMLLVVFALIAVPLQNTPVQAQEVTLTLGSWRIDDTAQIREILDVFNKANPGIVVKFDPTNPPDYNATLRTQLEGGTGPDLFYLRSFATSQQLFKEGHIASLKDLEVLKTAFDPASLVPWSSAEGEPYGVPIMAVSHGVYYNQDLFAELNIAVPTSWADLMTAAQTIKDAGKIPFANATGESWTIAEIVLMNIAPTFIGGREGRMEYLEGKRCFNDADAVSVFAAVGSLAPFLPAGQQALKYSDSLQLFLQGEAAMWFGGSWDIPAFEAEAPDFSWSVFAVPAPEGKESAVTFHLDAAIGMNANSKNKEAATKFLEWLGTEEFATMLGDKLPGFFPLLKDAKITLSNEHADAFLKLNEGRKTDIRWAWEKLLDTPSDMKDAVDGYTLMQDNAIAVINGKETPEEAANALQAGLAVWYKPAMTCGK